MTSREQFEDKYALLMGKTIASIRDCRHESGYREWQGCTMEIAWRMWQASRAAIEVNLTDMHLLLCDQNDVVDELSKHGLKARVNK